MGGKIPLNPGHHGSPILLLQSELHPKYILNLFIYFMCLNVSPTCMYVLCVCGWYPERREDVIRCPRRGIAENCNVVHGVWEPDIGSVNSLNLNPISHS